jgi:hypothetical protein
MPTKNNKKNLELVQYLGDLIVKLTMKNFGPKADLAKVRKYDELSDKLVVCLRKIVREGIHDDTDEFLTHAASLAEVNGELQKTFDDVTKLAETLKTLVNFVKVVEKIVKLVPQPVF